MGMVFNEYEPIQEIQVLDDIKKKIANTQELKAQWKKVADTFVKHKWIYRYITESQMESLKRHYAVLTSDTCYYSEYKRSFKAICKFMGLPDNSVIIENLVFNKNSDDKDQWQIAVKYSKGLVKVQIPEGVHLIHISPVPGIKELVPTYRSKTKGKYLYPSKRVFFTVAKDIKKNQAGLEGQKSNRYTPKSEIRNVYIDPTYSEFSTGAVYVDTESPIPVETVESKADKFAKTLIGNKKETDADHTMESAIIDTADVFSAMLY